MVCGLWELSLHYAISHFPRKLHVFDFFHKCFGRLHFLFASVVLVGSGVHRSLAVSGAVSMQSKAEKAGLLIESALPVMSVSIYIHLKIDGAFYILAL